jgi:hypothetical protein
MVAVEVDGVPYQEMHVDGGASAQVFLHPPSLRRTAAALGESIERQARVYVIRNSSLTPSGDPVVRQTINIAARTIDSLIHTQGIGDLYRIYLTTQRDGLDFNLAYIDEKFVYEGKKEQFETAYMVKLFDYGRELGHNGYPWRKTPPGFDDPVNSELEDAATAPPAGP